MKRNLFLILVFAILLSFTACGKPANSDNGKLKVVCSVFPLYDWARNIIGDSEDVELTLLLSNGTDMHSYQPTATDIITISNSDIFLYVGGESDRWVSDVLNNNPKNGRKAIGLLDTLIKQGKAKEECDAYPMIWDPDEPYDPSQPLPAIEPEYDEHIWLSLENAKACCELIGTVLSNSRVGDANRPLFAENADSYIEKLEALDKQYEDAVSAARVKAFLFGDRFPFLYLAVDYRIKTFAAFPGCSAETEASFLVVSLLAGKVDELGLKTILTIDGSDGAVANTIRSNTATKDQQILTLDSMQSVTAKDIENGVTYLSIMEKNLEVLKEALK